jgi:hypothetical protein
VAANDDPGRILAAARLIRSYLGELLSAGEAETFDQLVARQLGSDVPDEEKAQRVKTVLDSRPSTAAWLDIVVADDGLRPPELQEWESRQIEPVSGQLPVPAMRYVCPQGDFDRYLRSVGQEPGRCPTHDVDLVSA